MVKKYNPIGQLHGKLNKVMDEIESMKKEIRKLADKEQVNNIEEKVGDIQQRLIALQSVLETVAERE